MPETDIEMSKSILRRVRSKAGDHVVVSGRADRTRVVSRLGNRLESCQIAMNPKLAIFLGIMQGDEVDVGGPVRVGGNETSDAEDFIDILGMSQDRLVPLMGDDLHHFNGLTVRQVLDHLERHGNDFAGRYMVVGPNPEGVGIPVGEACEDPSLDVKVWDPEER